MSTQDLPAVAIGRAPGRIDFLGGFAEHCGSWVMKSATRARIRVALWERNDNQVYLTSRGRPDCQIPLTEVLDWIAPGHAPATVRFAMQSRGVPEWAHYVLGSWAAFANHTGWLPQGAVHLQAESNLPSSQGFASSTALAVATLRALASWSGLKPDPLTVARLAAWVESEIVGSSCSPLDTLAVNLGLQGHLLPILSRPEQVHAPLRLPTGLAVVGWCSGARHGEFGSTPNIDRTAASMGKRMIESALGRPLSYLTDLEPDRCKALLPDTAGSEAGDGFLARHGGVDDPFALILPGRRYPVRAAVLFTVSEHQRAREAQKLLSNVVGHPSASDLGPQLGQLLFDSHASYSALGLATPETDQMVELLRELGRSHGVHGARSAAEGHPGTVVALVDEARLDSLQQRLKRFSPAYSVWIR